MPQHQSAIKRMRQNEKRRTRNHAKQARARTMMKKLRATDNKEEAEALLREVKGALDRLAAKGIIHKNKAANYKSKLQKHVSSLD